MNLKKVIATMVATLMLVGTVTSGYALEKDCAEGPNGVIPITEEELEIWRAEHPEETWCTDEGIMPMSSNIWVNLSVTYYGQETKTSCGPACVRMALKTITGTTYSESTIRSACGTGVTGTAVSKMATYLNEKQSKYSYSAKHSDPSNLLVNIYSTLSKSAPVIVGVSMNTDDGWFYNSVGHYLLVYGGNSNMTQFKIADPWGGYEQVSEWKKYTVSGSMLQYHGYNVLHGYIA